MAKLEREIEGKKYEIDFTEDEALNSLDLKKEGVLDKILKFIGAKEPEKPTEPEKIENKDVSTDNSELKAFKDAYTEDMKALKEVLGQLAQQKVDEGKQTTLTKSEELIQKAVADRRIAPGEVDKWKEKFAGLYGSKIEILEDALNSRQVDESLQATNPNGNQNPNGNSGETAGIPTFKREQLRDLDFYEANQVDIAKAQQAGTIID